jgi:uncharacterized protein YuzE
MADIVKVWFDPEGDFLEVRFSDAPGFMQETANDAIMQRVDEQGRVIGFTVMGMSRIASHEPLEAVLCGEPGPLMTPRDHGAKTASG